MNISKRARKREKTLLKIRNWGKKTADVAVKLKIKLNMILGDWS